HMVAQVLPPQPLQLLILAWRDAESRFGYFCGQDFIVPVFSRSALLPFISQLFTNNNSTHSLFYPIFAVPLELVEHPRPFGRQFWVFYLLHSFIPHLCQPPFERLGL